MYKLIIRQLIILFFVLILLSSSVFAYDNKVADNETLYEYKSALEDEKPGTRLSGRVWSDKTVYSNENKTIEVDNHSIKSEDDFVEVYSALGSNSKIGEAKNTPIDLVLTLDCSSSMGNLANDPELASELGREPILMDETVKALNQLITFVMNQNPENRFALVVYQSKPKTIFPLGRYINADGVPFVSITTSENPYAETPKLFTVNFKALNSEQLLVEGTVTNDPETSDLGTRTNFQNGFNQGLKILSDESSSQRKINRPKLINLSDGVPTEFSLDHWNKIENFDNTKKAEELYEKEEALILQTILSTAYLKAAVNKNYGYPLQFIMLQIDTLENLDEEAQTILDGILNKDDYLNSNSNLDNEKLNNVKEKFKEWLSGKDQFLKLDNNKETITIPAYETIEDNYHITKEELLENITYSDLNEDIPASEQSQVFQDLMESFKQKEFHPIDDSDQNSDSSYITYHESIGEYMKVKPLKMLLFDKEYNFKKDSESKSNSIETYHLVLNSTTKVFNNSYSDSIQADLNRIQFILETNQTKQELTIKIPENCLPVLSSEVNCSQNYEDTENRVIEEIKDNRETIDSLPIRFIYGVSLDKSVLTSDGKVDLTKISKEYQNEHLKDNQIEFLTTEFKNTLIQNTNESYGNAYTSFLPALNNTYYKSQEETPVYLDSNLNSVLTDYKDILNSNNYYIEKFYYGFKNNLPTILNQINSIEGTILNNNIKNFRGTSNSKAVTIQPGQNYIGDLHEFSEEKSENLTLTADLAYYPVIDEENDPNGVVNTYLGNNGKMALTVSFDINISITKYQAIGENSLTKDRLTVSAADIITYQLKINNLTNSKIEDIFVTDEVPEGLALVPNSISNNGTFISGILTWTLDLDPQEEVNLTYKTKIQNTSIKSYKNIFSVEYEDNKKTITKDSNIVEAILNQPDLSIVKYQAVNNLEKTKNKQQVNPGDYLAYYFEITNNGTGDATNATISDTIPAELIVDENSISTYGTHNGNTITWVFPVIKAGEVKRCSFAVNIPENSVRSHWENTALINHDQNLTPESSNTVVVDKNEVDLSIEKLQLNSSSINSIPTKNTLMVNPNNTITYYLNVTNNSQLNSVYSVNVSDTIPNDLTIVSDSISNNGSINNQTINWTIPVIQPGSSVQLTFQIVVPANNQNKSWNNTASLNIEDNPSETINSNTVTIQQNTDPIKTNTNSDSINRTNQTNTRTVSTVSTNPKTGNSSNFNALIWLIGLVSVLLLTGQTYSSFK